MIFVPIWALTLIANILEFTGRKIAANNRRERIKEKRLKAADKKRLEELSMERARLKRLRRDHLLETQVEFLRVEKSKRVEKEIKARIEALTVPVSDDPYGGDE